MNPEEIEEGWGIYEASLKGEKTHYYILEDRDKKEYKSACGAVTVVTDYLTWCEHLSFIGPETYCSQCERIKLPKDGESVDYNFMEELEGLK